MATGQYKRDQGGRFAAVNSLTSHAREEVSDFSHKHPVATTAGAVGGAVFGVKSGSYARGAVALRRLDSAKAGRLAHQLNQGHSYRVTRNLLDPKDAFVGAHPLGQIFDQHQAFKGAKSHIDRDLHGAAGQMKRASDLWADTFAGVKDSRRAAEGKIAPIDILNFNHRPKHKIMQRVVENSPTNQQELFRGMGMKSRPKVGDEFDLDQTSWSDDANMASQFAARQSLVNSSPSRLLAGQRKTNQSHGGGGEPVVLRLQPGSGRATKISNLTRTKQGEHVSPKGRYRVVSDDDRHVYVERIEKSLHHGDPFGLTEMVSKNLTQEQIDRRKKAQSKISITTATLGLGALGALGAKTGARPALRAGVKRGLLKPVNDKKLESFERKADSARNTALTLGAGIGGAGGYNFASYTSAEAKQRQKNKIK